MVVGVADHSGWAFLISTAAIDGVPTIVDKRRVELIDEGVPTQPYHHETLSLRDDESERLLRTVKKSIAVSTAQQLDRLSADLLPKYHVSSITIRQPTIPRLPTTIGEAHRSHHTLHRADGMLYHFAICNAARQRDWKVSFHNRGEELATAAAALAASTADVEQFIDGLRPALRPPWAAEHRHAFAAAIGRLPKLKPLRDINLVTRGKPT